MRNAGEMIDIVRILHSARDCGEIGYGTANELAARTARCNLIKNSYLVAGLQKRGDKMLSDKAASPCDQGSAHDRTSHMDNLTGNRQGGDWFGPNSFSMIRMAFKVSK